jgi:hypothetical protein
MQVVPDQLRRLKHIDNAVGAERRLDHARINKLGMGIAHH